MPEDVLFLPGLLCDARLWRDQVAGLEGLARPAVADLTQDDSIDGMARRALALMPGRFALCGLSMGGYVALAIMRAAPERVTRLCLMDSSARGDTPEQAHRRRLLIGQVRMAGPLGLAFKGVTPRLLPSLLHPAKLADAELVGVVTGMAERVGREAFLRQQQAILGRPDSLDQLAAIAVPSLVAVGEADRLTPPARAEEMAARIPGARLVRIPGCGHLPPLEAPELVTGLLRDWLAATPTFS